MQWFADGWPFGIFLVVLLRYLILAALAYFIFYFANRQKWQYKKIQPGFPTVSDYLREVLFSVSTSVIFAAIGYLLFMTPLRTYTRIYTRWEDFGMVYFILSIPMMLVIHDAYFYWVHRFMHLPHIFKIFHKVHHLSTNPSPWAAFAFHPFEAVIEAGIIVVVALIMPVHPLALALFLLIMMAYNVYGHLGYELYPKGFSKSRVGRWINTSVNHNQHHQHFMGNYGLYFLWWDRWMGTLRQDYDSHFESVKSRIKPLR